MHRSFLAIAVGLVAAAAACSGADEHPLGGAFGGTAAETDPNGGSTADGGGTSGHATSGGSTTSSGGSTTSSGGSTTSSGGSTTSSGGSTTSSGGSTSGASGSTSSSSGASGSTSSSSGASGSTSSSSSSSSSGSSGSVAPTWTQLFNSYMKVGTVGNCAKSGCHSSTSTPSGCFNYVTGRGYSPALMVDPNQSPFTWFGGNMPVNGSANAAAAKDFNAWYAAGGKNN